MITSGLLLGGCSKEEPAKAEAPAKASKTAKEARKLSVDEVDQLLQAEKKPLVFDANSDSTRKKYGTLPGAKLLSSTDAAEVKAALPESKNEKLLFYCSNTKCNAGEKAANKALEAGYADVNVMPAGIKGWAQAGKKTNQI